MSKYPIRLMKELKDYCKEQATCDACPILNTCKSSPRDWTVIEEPKKSRKEYQHDYYMSITKRKRAEKRKIK